MAAWSKLTFGKYCGKSLPWVIFHDLDWFLWAAEEAGALSGAQATEAKKLLKRARRIKIPEHMIVEYIIDPSTGKLSHIEIVPEEQEDGSSTRRSKYIDLTAARRLAKYDKLGNSRLIDVVKQRFFETNVRMTAKKSEEFFDNDAIFDLEAPD